MTVGAPSAARVVLAFVIAWVSAGAFGVGTGLADTPQSAPPTTPQTAASPQPPPPREPPPSAEATAGKLPQQPTFRVEANYVRVDVIATRDGVAVHDLTQADFELFEDRAPQKIAAFEHVLVRPAGPQTTRFEPNTVAESRNMAANPRGRTFVLFLDRFHVTVAGSHIVRAPIIRMLDRIIGQDDLVGVMTPDMSAADIALARKTDTIEGMLTKYWTWGVRHSLVPADAVEGSYEQCYPEEHHKSLVYEMIDRRREMLLLDALTDLVRHLQTLRDERKAILVFSEGWALFRPNQSLARQLKDAFGQDYPIPGTPEIGVTPDGKITTGTNARDVSRGSLYKCDTDRMHLAHIDNDRAFKNLIDEANRANATFYPVDPRGLAVFDAPIGPRPPPDVITDANNLRNRLESLHTLAVATDGIAVVNSNDLDRGLKRVSDDLSSYYLLGYYSTNTKLDGAYRSISVKLKRPGLEIRARRGYRAATAEEIAKGRIASSDVPADPEAAAVKHAIDAIASARSDLPIRVSAAVDRVSRPGETLVWVTGELDAKTAQTLEWQRGGTATVTIVAGRNTVAQGQASIATGARTFVIAVPATLAAGDYRLQIRATPATEGRALADGVALDVRAPASGLPMIGAPLMFRKGPSSGNAFRPTADVRFRRNEAIRIEAPVSADLKEPSATLLGRTGQPIRVPVTVEVVSAAASAGSDPAVVRSGTWVAAYVSLAPLAAGDYAIALGGKAGDKTERVVVGFKVIP